MTATAKIRNAGYSLTLDDGDLVIEPFSKLTPNQLAFLKSHKAEIVAELRQEQAANHPMTPAQWARIYRWYLSLDGIKAADELADLRQQCEADPAARQYFLRRADETDTDDDRHYCRECRHLSGDWCKAQRRRPVDTHPRRCADFLKATWV